MIIRLTILLVPLAAVTACETRPVQSLDTVPVARPATVALVGFGAARFGMTREQFTAAGGGEIPAAPGGEACRVVHPASFPAGVRVMLVNDTIARVDVDSGVVP